MSFKLKNRRNSVPNGFLYRQAITGWQNWDVAPNSVWDFHLLCRELQKHRLANPKYRLATDMTAIENEVDRVNAIRVAALPGAESYVTADPAPSFHQPPRSIAVKLVSAVEALKTGKEATDDWLDSEIPPVSQEVSERRAVTCVKCPLNGMGSLSRWFTIPAAALITRRLEKLHARKLSTSLDNQLGTCEACLCRNQLKVHEPLELVLKHTSEEVRARLDANCWVITEAK
jgi:hypothetical protein